MKLKEVNMTKVNPTDDIKSYLTTFECTAKFVSCLTGKAQAGYAATSIAESND